MINKLKIKNFVFKLKLKAKLFFSHKIYVSFGENCLTDNILERHNLKTITTPFSHGRSNVEYILQLEKDNYKDFLNLNYLNYETLNNKAVPRLKKYNAIINDYNELHKNGFEFTHHDVIKNEDVRLKIVNRLVKLRSLIGRKKLILLYHHRSNSKTNLDLLFQNLNELKQIYSTRKISSEVVCFKQNIVTNDNERKLVQSKINGIHYFEFNTLKAWEGDEQDIFWARCDEDLIKEMINYIQKI